MNELREMMKLVATSKLNSEQQQQQQLQIIVNNALRERLYVHQECVLGGSAKTSLIS